jgi:hypothetical protein
MVTLSQFLKILKLRAEAAKTGIPFQAMRYDDVAIATLWDKSDEERIDKELALIRDGKLPADTFESKLTRYHNDQTLPRESEPLEQTEPKHDLVVNAGLVRIAQLVTGKSSAYFNHFASGTGVALERPSDVRLAGENFRVSMVSSGFIEAVGTVMKFTGKFPSFLPNALITEGGVFDFGEPHSGTMLFRTLYPTTSRIDHIQGRTFYSLMQSINQVSVT